MLSPCGRVAAVCTGLVALLATLNCTCTPLGFTKALATPGEHHCHREATGEAPLAPHASDGPIHDCSHCGTNIAGPTSGGAAGLLGVWHATLGALYSDAGRSSGGAPMSRTGVHFERPPPGPPAPLIHLYSRLLI